jgi:hypothetical protein
MGTLKRRRGGKYRGSKKFPLPYAIRGRGEGKRPVLIVGMAPGLSLRPGTPFGC